MVVRCGQGVIKVKGVCLSLLVLPVSLHILGVGGGQRGSSAISLSFGCHYPDYVPAKKCMYCSILTHGHSASASSQFYFSCLCYHKDHIHLEAFSTIFAY